LAHRLYHFHHPRNHQHNHLHNLLFTLSFAIVKKPFESTIEVEQPMKLTIFTAKLAFVAKLERLLIILVQVFLLVRPITSRIVRIKFDQHFDFLKT